MPTKEQKTLKVLYRNYRGEVSERHVMPVRIWYGVSPYHAEEGFQWFLEAMDLDKPAGQNMRDFAFKDLVGENFIEAIPKEQGNDN